jgi:hypothetical protein
MVVRELQRVRQLRYPQSPVDDIPGTKCECLDGVNGVAGVGTAAVKALVGKRQKRSPSLRGDVRADTKAGLPQLAM